MTVRLSDVERGYARDGDGITMRGRWYSEASVERILAARLAEAEQRALFAAADALNKRWYEKEAEMPNTHATSCWLDGHESAEQFVRSLAAQQRDEGDEPVDRAHSCPDGKCKERHERAWGG